MKDQVIKALKQEGKPQAQFNELLQLFMKHKEHNYGQARFLNRAGFSKVNLENLKYDMQKLYGIRAVDLAAPLKVVEKTLSPEEQLLAIDFETISIDDLLQATLDLDQYSGLSKMLPEVPPTFTKGSHGNKEMKEWLASKNVEHTLTTKKEMAKLISETSEKEAVAIHNNAVENLKAAQKTLREVEQAAQNQAEIRKIFNDAPDNVKGGMKLRDQYPFLNEDDCPDKLKILVADMISAFNNYMGAREEIQKLVADGKEEALFEIAKIAVENFELNKEIRDELDYYKEHKEVLGNHPIFADEQLQEKVNSYNKEDLKSKRANLRSYITKEKKKLASSKDNKSKAVIQSKIDAHLEHISLIEVRLGVDGKK